MSTIAERVAKGAALLDERRPGWPERVNVATLNVDDCWRCPLGQVFGGYASGVFALNLGDHDTIAHGFAGTHDEAGDDLPVSDEELAALTAEWARVITERQAGAMAT
jgi:hypothetical protein